MRTIDKNIFNSENYGGEFSVFNSYTQQSEESLSSIQSKIYTAFLYFLSIVSIVFWVISLNILPFGHAFQFLLGSAVLAINFLVFKWVRL